MSLRGMTCPELVEESDEVNHKNWIASLRSQ